MNNIKNRKWRIGDGTSVLSVSRGGNMRTRRAGPWHAGLATGVPKPGLPTAGLATCATPSETERFMPNSEVGEHTRPRVWLDAPRVQPLCARTPPKLSGLFRACEVFREGAENGTRGACAPHPTSEFGFMGREQAWRTGELSMNRGVGNMEDGEARSLSVRDGKYLSTRRQRPRHAGLEACDTAGLETCATPAETAVHGSEKQ